MNVLSEKTLQACSGDDAAVVLARVVSARISAPGTRSESAMIELEVERTICGSSPPAVSVWRYTSRGNTILQQGRRYVVAVVRGSGPVPYGLGDFVLVPEGREAEAVQAHLRIVQRMAPSGATSGNDTARQTRKVTILDEQVLRAAIDHGESIALVHVIRASISSPGTRSELAVLEVAVERSLRGDIPSRLSLCRYTSRGDTVLQPGKKYVVTFDRGDMTPVPWELGAFVAVAEGTESHAVDAHLAALRRLTPGGT